MLARLNTGRNDWQTRLGTKWIRLWQRTFGTSKQPPQPHYPRTQTLLKRTSVLGPGHVRTLRHVCRTIGASLAFLDAASFVDLDADGVSDSVRALLNKDALEEYGDEVFANFNSASISRLSSLATILRAIGYRHLSRIASGIASASMTRYNRNRLRCPDPTGFLVWDVIRTNCEHVLAVCDSDPATYYKYLMAAFVRYMPPTRRQPLMTCKHMRHVDDVKRDLDETIKERREFVNYLLLNAATHKYEFHVYRDKVAEMYEGDNDQDNPGGDAEDDTDENENENENDSDNSICTPTSSDPVCRSIFERSRILPIDSDTLNKIIRESFRRYPRTWIFEADGHPFTASQFDATVYATTGCTIDNIRSAFFSDWFHAHNGKPTAEEVGALAVRMRTSGRMLRNNYLKTREFLAAAQHNLIPASDQLDETHAVVYSATSIADRHSARGEWHVRNAEAKKLRRYLALLNSGKRIYNEKHVHAGKVRFDDTRGQYVARNASDVEYH